MRFHAALVLVVWAICGACSMADEKSSVESYLKENLNDPDYEVVGWYDACDLKGAKIFSPPPGAQGKVPRMGNSHWKDLATTGKALRMKYRAKNENGAKILHDEVFLIGLDGMVARTVDNFDFRLAGESPEQWAKRTGFDRSEKSSVEVQRTNAQSALKGLLAPAKK
jgi:hypothetical protein